MRILVTGIFGFIGSTFAKLLMRETQHHVVGFGRYSSQLNVLRLEGIGGGTNGRFLLTVGDLCNAIDVSGICEDIDVVVNFAAKTFVDHSIRDPQPFIQSNIVGTYNLLEQARKYNVQRFVQVSTDEVYGAILAGSHKEDAPLNPTNPYAAAKAAADMLALSYYRTYNLPVIVTRTENNYGPFQHRQKAMPTFVRHALNDEPIPVYGDGGHSRMWLHVDDHCRAILHLIEKDHWAFDGQIFHIAGEQELTNLELAEMILTMLDKPIDRVRFIADNDIRPGHDRRYALNSEKIRSLGWAPKHDLQSGIESTVKWYKDNAWWLS